MLWRFIKMSVGKYKQYKSEFVYTFIVLTVNVIMVPAMWFGVTGGGQGTLAGWSFESLTLLSIFYGVFLSIANVVGLWELYYTLTSPVGRKKFLTYMYRPVHPLILVYGNSLDFAGLVKLVLYLIFLFLLVTHFHITFPPLSLFLLLMGGLLFVLFLNIPVLVVMGIERSGSPVAQILWTFMRYADLPLTEMKGLAWALVSVFVPIVYIIALPIKSVFESPPVSVVIQSVVVVLAVLFLNVLLWRWALRRYEGVGE